MLRTARGFLLDFQYKCEYVAFANQANGVPLRESQIAHLDEDDPNDLPHQL